MARPPRPEVRERIVAQALEAFVARGYHATHLRELAAAAGVGLGTINYLFAHKEQLYRAAIERARQLAAESRAMETHSDAFEKARAPQDVLRRHIHRLVRQMHAGLPSGYLHRLITHEHHQPTFALADMAQRDVAPEQARLAAMVAAIRPDLDVPTCASVADSVLAQVLFHRRIQQVRQLQAGAATQEPPDLVAGAAHIVRFTLAAIEAMAAHPPP